MRQNQCPGDEVASSGRARPRQVLIYDFAVNPADVQQNASIFARLRSRGNSNQTQEQTQFGRETADALATELTRKIAAMGLNPVRTFENMPVPPNSVLITGQFVNIDEGNRLRRTVIGLGKGKSSLDAEVSLLAPGPSDGLYRITGLSSPYR